ncbi:MAG: hypothetical protein PUH85_06870, partial [Firmicutes bacterium]|nr:hypothetical protein [Bacillota bacterium]
PAFLQLYSRKSILSEPVRYLAWIILACHFISFLFSLSKTQQIFKCKHPKYQKSMDHIVQKQISSKDYEVFDNYNEQM